MRVVVQRVLSASVTVNSALVGAIERGLLVYLGVGADDTERDLDYLVGKVAGLRIFPDEAGHMNQSVLDVSGTALVIPHIFTSVLGARQHVLNAQERSDVDE